MMSDHRGSFQQRNEEKKRDNEDSDEDAIAIPFIKFIPEQGKFELDKEAEEFLKGLGDVKLGVVAVCGKYRTGKSYLLNKLFVETYFQKKRNATGNQLAQKSVFNVSPTINACTKGLWLWKRVIKTENDVSMIVVDTEGLGAYDEDENHDSKIFLLALLLSSLLIYNSVGTIDENALNSLSLVINLAKKIQLKKSPGQEETQDDIDQLATMFPQFLWVLRDFALKMVDLDGAPLTPKQYLETALREQKGCSEAAESKNRVRRLLSHFFPERDCCTLVRPTEQEKNLQNLVQLSDKDLRQEFLEQMAKLKHKVFSKARPKTMNGHSLNGCMLVELAQSYVSALNNGEIPVIESAWTNVCQFEQQRAFREAQVCYQTLITTRLKCNKDPDIDIKAVLREIRDKALLVLKKDFIGDLKQLEQFKEKLSIEVKTNSKAAVKEISTRLDEQLTDIINKRLDRDLEARVRRCHAQDTELKDFDTLLALSEQLLTQLLSEHPHHQERLEFLYRRIISQSGRLGKMLQTVHNNHFKTPSATAQTLLEHQLKMREEECARQKTEKMGLQKEQWEKDTEIERERRDMIMKVKLFEVKLLENEEKLKEADTQLKFYRGRKQIESCMQTEAETKVLQFDRFTQANPSTYSQSIQTVSSSEQTSASVNTDPINLSATHVQSKSLSSPPPYIEQNMKLLQEILQTLNSNQNLNTSEEMTDLLKSNQILSNAIDQSERRCSHLEEKVAKKTKYENLVKKCQRLQCKECNHLYTPALFTQHVQHCGGAGMDKKRTSNLSNGQMVISGIVPAGGQASPSPQQEPYEEEVQTPHSTDSDNQTHQYEGGCCEDLYHQKTDSNQIDSETIGIGMANFTEFLRHHQQLMYENNDHFLAKVINIDSVDEDDQNISIKKSPNIKQNSQLEKDLISTIMITFCVFNQGTVTSLTRTLQEVKQVMFRVQKRVKSPTEQCQIEKWIIEVENSQDARRIAEIVETFFSTIHKRCVENGLQLNKHVIIEDIDGYQAPQHFYINEFVEFFNLQGTLPIIQEQIKTQSSCGVKPFKITESIGEHKELKKRYTMGGDDEVIMQTPYEDDDQVFSAAISGSSYGVPALQEIASANLRPQQPIANPGANERCTTLNLDGEQSIDANSALHMVSFFSIEGDDHQVLHKNLLNKDRMMHEEDEPSSSLQSSMELNDCHANADFQVVSAKEAPFAQIQNHVVTTLTNNSITSAPIFEQGKLSDLIVKRGYQSHLSSIQPIALGGKKSDISKRGVMPSPKTQQHQSYFSNTAAQTGLRKSKGTRAGGLFTEKK